MMKTTAHLQLMKQKSVPARAVVAAIVLALPALGSARTGPRSTPVELQEAFPGLDAMCRQDAKIRQLELRKTALQRELDARSEAWIPTLSNENVVGIGRVDGWSKSGHDDTSGNTRKQHQSTLSMDFALYDGGARSAKNTRLRSEIALVDLDLREAIATCHIQTLHEALEAGYAEKSLRLTERSLEAQRLTHLDLTTRWARGTVNEITIAKSAQSLAELEGFASEERQRLLSLRKRFRDRHGSDPLEAHLQDTEKVQLLTANSSQVTCGPDFLTEGSLPIETLALQESLRKSVGIARIREEDANTLEPLLGLRTTAGVDTEFAKTTDEPMGFRTTLGAQLSLRIPVYSRNGVASKSRLQSTLDEATLHSDQARRSLRERHGAFCAEVGSAEAQGKRLNAIEKELKNVESIFSAAVRKGVVEQREHIDAQRSLLNLQREILTHELRTLSLRLKSWMWARTGFSLE